MNENQANYRKVKKVNFVAHWPPIFFLVLSFAMWVDT